MSHLRISLFRLQMSSSYNSCHCLTLTPFSHTFSGSNHFSFSLGKQSSPVPEFNSIFNEWIAILVSVVCSTRRIMVSGSAPKRAGVVKDAPEDFWRRTWRCLSSFRCPGNGSEVSFFSSLSPGKCLCPVPPFYLFFPGASIAETSSL
ncbi:hypothetical protein CDAR_498751 [Caerostris darwini]|uniref:Uncharacterized protein n=1 Tax=Caerostris darwini TaxID=1538125 RepID=A0AAV4SNC9_9ARAC|nr:hypothetical protein CDAR_498751 [Caerostris darwini]